MPELRHNGTLGGIIGITLGGLSWAVLAGISIGSILATVLPLALGIFGLTVAVSLHKSNPNRASGIIGAILLWVVVIDIICVNLMYSKIPAKFLGITTGKDMFSLESMNIFLGLIALLGFYRMYKDLKDGLR